MTVVGTEEVAGVDTYHIAINVDVTKMITDLSKMMQSPDVSDALGGATGDLGAAEMPSDDDLAEIESAVKQASLDVWSQTDTFYPRKMAVSAEIVPPADEANGLESMKISMEIVYETVNEPVTVEAPTDAKPWKDLQPALEGLGGLLGGSSI